VRWVTLGMLRLISGLATMTGAERPQKDPHLRVAAIQTDLRVAAELRTHEFDFVGVRLEEVR
jgi:hypothetical protein